MFHLTKERKNSILSILLIICILICPLSACETEKKGENESFVEFSDALGREIILSEKPQRVAALLGSFADIWVLSGGELCAAASDAWEDFGLSLDGAVNIGGAHSPSLELLLSAEPDFVIASASTSSNVKMINTLEKMGITVAYFDVDNFEDYLSMLDICTEITERRDLYEQNGLSVKARIDEIKENYSEYVAENGEQRVLLLRASSTSVKAKGSEGTVLGEMLDDMGCVNIADNDKTLLENLSVEAVIKEEPQCIFAVTMGNDGEAAKNSLENMMKESSAWGTLEAVREDRFFVMDKTLFNLKPNERFADAYEILYEKLTAK